MRLSDPMTDAIRGTAASPAATGRRRAGAALGPVTALPLVTVRPLVLLGSIALLALLVGTMALVTLRTGGTTDSAESDDASAPAHPDAWQVRRLLDEHGGRLPQSEIVERTGWSKSKVSRVLSAMAEDDQVRKIRLGRENLVTRPGEEPEHAGSPFDEDARNR